MIVEDTKDLVETDDYVIIEANFHQPNLTKRPGSYPPGYFYAHFAFQGCRWGSAVGVRAYIVRGTWVLCDEVLQIICKRTAKSIDGC